MLNFHRKLEIYKFMSKLYKLKSEKVAYKKCEWKKFKFQILFSYPGLFLSLTYLLRKACLNGVFSLQFPSTHNS